MAQKAGATSVEQPRRHSTPADVALVVVSLLSVVVVLTLGIVSIQQTKQAHRLADQIADIEAQRNSDEVLQERVQDFVAHYYSLTCQEQLELLEYPLDDWFGRTGEGLSREAVETASCLPNPAVEGDTVFVIDEISIGRTVGDDLLTATFALRYNSTPLLDQGEAIHRQDGISYGTFILHDVDTVQDFSVKGLREVVVRTTE